MLNFLKGNLMQALISKKNGFPKMLKQNETYPWP